MVNLEELLAQAIKYRNEEKFEEAIAAFESLHREFPQDARVNYHFAWLNDKMGRETTAVPYYVAAIENGLEGEELRGALLGLGSTYRTIGEYEKAVETLQKGAETFPDAPEFTVFLAMALYNTGHAKEAVSSLLKVILETSEHPSIQRFERAIRFYAEDLDKVWLD